jgi:hypothetical protein
MKLLIGTLAFVVSSVSFAQPMEMRADGFAVAYKGTPSQEFSTVLAPGPMASGVEMTAIRVRTPQADNWYIIESIQREMLTNPNSGMFDMTDPYSLVIRTRPIECKKSNFDAPIYTCKKSPVAQPVQFTTKIYRNETDLTAIRLIQALSEQLNASVEFPLLEVDPAKQTGHTFVWSDSM